MNKLQKKLNALNIKLNVLIALKSSRAILVKVIVEILDIEAKIERLEEAKKLTLTLQTGKRQWKSWIAKITGFDKTYTFAREFIEPVDRKFDKKGETEATFDLTEKGIYHDSDGDYYIVNLIDGVLDYRIISYQEVKYILEQSPFIKSVA